MSVMVVVADLIFESKITATAGRLEVAVRIVRTPAEALDALSAARGVIVDMNLTTGDALKLLRDVKTARPELPVLAYLSHVQTELAEQTKEAGADEVLARSKFTEQLPEILRRLAG